MTTVERIIEAALKVFNANGISQASLRGIAEEVGISHGNLAYHFRNKGEILDEIYARMEREWVGAVYPGGDVTLSHYHSLIKRISEFHYRYRFFYLDLLEIARQYPRVIRRYRKAVAQRFEEHDQLMAALIRRGSVKREPAEGFYRSQFLSIWVMSTFWLQHKRVLGDKHPVIDAGSDIRHVWQIMLQHLTAKGLREFKEICAAEGGPRDHYPVTEPYSSMYLKSVG